MYETHVFRGSGKRSEAGRREKCPSHARVVGVKEEKRSRRKYGSIERPVNFLASEWNFAFCLPRALMRWMVILPSRLACFIHGVKKRECRNLWGRNSRGHPNNYGRDGRRQKKQINRVPHYFTHTIPHL